MDASPAKRRVLAPLDVNAPSPNAAASKQRNARPESRTHHGRPSSILSAWQAEQDDRKRTLARAAGEAETQLCKRICVEDATEQKQNQSPSRSILQRSVSPAASSVFDCSGVDTSQATTVTEPDADAAEQPRVTRPATVPMPLSRHRFTREETREKAEILRLRLGLASYKLRTGQTDIPLEELQMRPLQAVTRRVLVPAIQTHQPGPPRPANLAATTQVSCGTQSQRRPLPGSPVRRQSESQTNMGSQPDHTEAEASTGPTRPAGQDRVAAIHCHSSPSPERNGLPRLPPARPAAVDTPQRRSVDEDADTERLTSSALRGGAASGLLSLARG